jgi:hypothetical protein
MDDEPHWRVEIASTSAGDAMARWLDSLDEARYLAVRSAVMNQLEPHGMNLARTHWLRPLGGGLYELRIRHDRIEVAPGRWKRARILLRVFVAFGPGRTCTLLSGYDKGEDPSPRRQQKEIARARRLLRTHRSLN